MTKISFEIQMVERKMTWGRASTTIGSLVILFYLQCLIREKRHSTKAKPVQLCSVEFKFVKYCVFYWKFGARPVTMLTTARMPMLSRWTGRVSASILLILLWQLTFCKALPEKHFLYPDNKQLEHIQRMCSMSSIKDIAPRHSSCFI